MKRILVFAVLVCGMLNSWAQSYELVWEDNFDGTTLDPAIWNIEKNTGIWNTGSNQELQHYNADNITVGDDGNGNNCLILTAKKENYNGYAFTSGKIDTQGKFAFRYGKIEARIKLPDLANGLWPAFWLLGNTNLVWPACGEIDIMEAGHAEGITNNQQNTTFGGALHWEHADAYAGYGTTSVSPTSLDNGFHTFTMEWNASNISMYLDGSSTPYYSMNVDGEDAEEFRDYSMYIIFNLAVGGMFTDIYDQAGITAPLPAQMLVDYIKIYQKSGEGEVEEATPILGDLAIYADGKSYENSLDIGYDATISYAGASVRNGESAQEGSEVLAYNLSVGQDYNISVLSLANKNLTSIKSTGSVDVYLKTNSTADIQVGLGDATGTESWMTLNHSSNYNCSRDGSWSRVAIPFSAFSGLDFSQIDDVLMVKGTPAANSYLAIDKIILSNTTANFELFGIFTDNPAITERFIIDDNSGHLYVWNNTLEAIEEAPAYDGTEVLAFASPATNTWFGFGLTSDAGLDLSQFESGYLKLALRTSSTDNFWIGVGGANNTEAKIYFNNGSDPYGFTRNGQWQRMTIPVADLVAQGLDLASCGNVFMMGGEPYISDVLVDDIYFSASVSDVENTALNPDRNRAQIEDNEHKITADHYGVYTENPNVTEQFLIDDSDGHIYIWSNTLSALPGGVAYDGIDHLYFQSTGAGWYGFGIFSDEAKDLSHFSNGYLALSLKTSSSADFWVGIQGAAGSEGKITFNNGSPYNFPRDNQWHRVLIPMSALTSQGLDLIACGNIFMLGGATISDVAVDDIILTVSDIQPSNPNKDGATDVVFSENEDLRLFPNPVNDHFSIVSDEHINSVEILNQAGSICYKNTALDVVSVNINAANMTPGIYLMKISLTDGNTIVKKLIKK